MRTKKVNVNSKAIIEFLYSAHIENATPKSVMYGNGVVQTQYPVIGSDYKSEIEIMFYLVNKKYNNITDLKFILNGLLDKTLIEREGTSVLEAKYRLTHIGYDYIANIKSSWWNRILDNKILVRFMTGLGGVLISMVADYGTNHQLLESIASLIHRFIK